MALGALFSLGSLFPLGALFPLRPLLLVGEKLAGPIDLFSKENVTRLVELGMRVLERGEHRLVVEIVGSNPKAEPRHMLGLDYLRLQESP